MQRYFFNLADEAYPIDLQGTEFPSLDDARAEALRFAGEVFHERPELASAEGELWVEVTDPNRALIFTLMTAVTGASAGPPLARLSRSLPVCEHGLEHPHRLF